MWNIGSIVLGLAASILPLAAMGLFDRSQVKRRFGFSVLSFACCLAAVVFQLLAVRQRVWLQDWAALEDTISVLVTPSAVLCVVVVVLNLIALGTCAGGKK